MAFAVRCQSHGRDALRDALPRDPSSHVLEAKNSRNSRSGTVAGCSRLITSLLNVRRGIARERVPTASNVGSRDVTSASQPTPPLFPFRVFSRVSRALFLRQSGDTYRITGGSTRRETDSEGQVKYCRCTFFGHATPDRAGAHPSYGGCQAWIVGAGDYFIFLMRRSRAICGDAQSAVSRRTLDRKSVV